MCALIHLNHAHSDHVDLIRASACALSAKLMASFVLHIGLELLSHRLRLTTLEEIGFEEALLWFFCVFCTFSKISVDEVAACKFHATNETPSSVYSGINCLFSHGRH